MKHAADTPLLNGSKVYHGNPETRVLTRLIAAEMASRYVIDEPDDAPLDECVNELHRYLSPSDAITEFKQVRQALGIAPCTILLCDDLGDCLACYFGDEAGL